MHIARTAEALDADFDVRTRWIVDAATTGAAGGSIARIDMAPGARSTFRRYGGVQVTYAVVAGAGEIRDAAGSHEVTRGSAVHLMPGAWSGLTAGEDGLSVLMLVGAATALSQTEGVAERDALAGDEARPEIFHLNDIENHTVHNPEMGFFNMATRWLVTHTTGGSTSLVVGQATFVPGARHALHLHPHAGEFFYILEGDGAHVTEGSEHHPMGPGDMVYVPPQELHGFTNIGSTQLRSIFGYLGVGSLEAAGYEVWHPTEE